MISGTNDRAPKGVESKYHPENRNHIPELVNLKKRHHSPPFMTILFQKIPLLEDKQLEHRGIRAHTNTKLRKDINQKETRTKPSNRRDPQVIRPAEPNATERGKSSTSREATAPVDPPILLQALLRGLRLRARRRLGF